MCPFTGRWPPNKACLGSSLPSISNSMEFRQDVTQSGWKSWLLDNHIALTLPLLLYSNDSRGHLDLRHLSDLAIAVNGQNCYRLCSRQVTDQHHRGTKTQVMGDLGIPLYRRFSDLFVLRCTKKIREFTTTLKKSTQREETNWHWTKKTLTKHDSKV